MRTFTRGENLVLSAFGRSEKAREHAKVREHGAKLGKKMGSSGGTPIHSASSMSGIEFERVSHFGTASLCYRSSCTFIDFFLSLLRAVSSSRISCSMPETPRGEAPNFGAITPFSRLLSLCCTKRCLHTASHLFISHSHSHSDSSMLGTQFERVAASIFGTITPFPSLSSSLRTLLAFPNRGTFISENIYLPIVCMIWTTIVHILRLFCDYRRLSFVPPMNSSAFCEIVRQIAFSIWTNDFSITFRTHSAHP